MSPSGKSILWTAVYGAALVVALLLAWWPSLADKGGDWPLGDRVAEALLAPTPTASVEVRQIADPATATAAPPQAPSETLSATPRVTTTPVAEVSATREASPSEVPPSQALPSETATEAETEEPAATPTRTMTLTPEDTATPKPTATPTPAWDLTLLGELPEPHLWLERPVNPEAVDHVERWYPYGSTGEDEYPVHHGVEFVNPTGTDVLAVAPARVEVAGGDQETSYSYRSDFYGQLVVLRLEQKYGDQPVFALYGHLSEIFVQPGQLVDPGEPLGKVGMTGVALGPHLHFEVRVGENSYWTTRNPELWLKPLPGYGLIVGRVVTQDGKPLPEALVAVSRAGEPGSAWREAWTYTTRDIKIDGSRRLDQVNPDDDWPENWVVGDVPAGQYVVGVQVNDEGYAEHVTVREGEISYVVLVVE